MKRILVFCLVLAMSLTLLAGCTKSSDKGNVSDSTDGKVNGTNGSSVIGEIEDDLTGNGMNNDTNSTTNSGTNNNTSSTTNSGTDNNTSGTANNNGTNGATENGTSASGTNESEAITGPNARRTTPRR